MRVHGVIIPPRPVLEALASVVLSVPVPVEAGHSAPPPSQGTLGRRARRAGDEARLPETGLAAPALLDHVAVERMQLPITGFGNLTTSDAHRLAEVVKDAATAWVAPRVRFAGGTALEFPGDWSVWAKLDGDLSSLMAVARGVTQCVERLGFYVDRRQFRPMLPVATITDATTGSHLEAVVDALEAFRGEEWAVDLSLTKETFVGGHPDLTEFHRIPLVKGQP